MNPDWEDLSEDWAEENGTIDSSDASRDKSDQAVQDGKSNEKANHLSS